MLMPLISRPHHRVTVLCAAASIVVGVLWWRTAETRQQQTLAAPAVWEPNVADDIHGERPPRKVTLASQNTVNTVAVPDSRLPTGASRQPGPAANDEQELRSQLLGTWADEFYGQRTFHFRDDGTATMELELDSVGKLLYGPKLTFFVAWELQGDLLSLKMTGGEPKGSAVTLAKLFGESSQQRIEHVDADEMRLRSLDSQKVYVHRRVAPK